MSMTQEAAAGVWKRLEEHGKDIHTVRERLAVVESRHSEIKARYEEICIQLQVTDKRLSEKLDILLADHNKRQGQSTAASWLPAIINTVVALGVIVTMIRT